MFFGRSNIHFFDVKSDFSIKKLQLFFSLDDGKTYDPHNSYFLDINDREAVINNFAGVVGFIPVQVVKLEATDENGSVGMATRRVLTRPFIESVRRAGNHGLTDIYIVGNAFQYREAETQIYYNNKLIPNNLYILFPDLIVIKNKSNILNIQPGAASFDIQTGQTSYGVILTIPSK